MSFILDIMSIMSYYMSCLLSKGAIMKVGNSLRVWRAKKGVSQQQLADSVGLSRQTVNSIERGKFVPSVLTAMKLARYFDTSVDELFFMVEED